MKCMVKVMLVPLGGIVDPTQATYKVVVMLVLPRVPAAGSFVGKACGAMVKTPKRDPMEDVFWYS